MTTFMNMRAVNIKELKAKLSAYLRDAGRGDTILVLDRSRVCATLGPPPGQTAPGLESDPLITRLVALGFRPPLRARRGADGGPLPPGPELSAERIQQLLDDSRDDRVP